MASDWGHIYTSDHDLFLKLLNMCSEKSMVPYCERCSSTVGWILVNTIFEMTFHSTVKRNTGRRLLIGSFSLSGFYEAVSNLWPTLIYLCFAKMLLRDSAMRSYNSVRAYFRSSGVFDHIQELCCCRVCECFLTTSFLVIGVSRGLILPTNVPSFDSCDSQ